MPATTLPVIQLIALLFTIVLLSRLLLSGLFLKYRWFTALVTVGLIRYALPVIPVSKTSYAYLWMGSEVVMWALYAMALYELYTLVLERFPGIRTLTGWMFLASLILATILAMLALQAGSSAKPPDTLMLFLTAERSVLSALAVLVLMMTAFLTWFPVRLPRNLVWHSILFAVYFFLKAGTLLVRNLYGHETTRLLSNTAIPIIGSICMVLWAVMLKPAGEQTFASIGHRWNQEEEDRLLDQLKEINTSLSRLSR
jgi:hypothetical protein